MWARALDPFFFSDYDRNEQISRDLRLLANVQL